jgi:hypothetical protein
LGHNHCNCWSSPPQRQYPLVAAAVVVVAHDYYYCYFGDFVGLDGKDPTEIINEF